MSVALGEALVKGDADGRGDTADRCDDSGEGAGWTGLLPVQAAVVVASIAAAGSRISPKVR